MNIVFITPSLSSNSLGRTYSLWLITQALGWKSAVQTMKEEPIWEPLSGTEFADSCVVFDRSDDDVLDHLIHADLIVAIKPLEDSFLEAIKLAVEFDKPLLLDVDDPDLEGALSWHRPLRRFAKGVLRPRLVQRKKRLRRLAVETPTIVSNPVLQSIYGGTVIPHVRVDPGAGNAHLSLTPTVAFVGTNRAHKGVTVLRGAVAKGQDFGCKLVITDSAPADARPWEDWIGRTTLDQGRAIVDQADVVVIPSPRSGDAIGQLPAKLIDAMISGRAIVVTDVEPLPWAIGGAGIVVKPSDPMALTAALRTLADPHARARLGAHARATALERFTVGAVTSAFSAACSRVVSEFRSQNGITSEPTHG